MLARWRGSVGRAVQRLVGVQAGRWGWLRFGLLRARHGNACLALCDHVFECVAPDLGEIAAGHGWYVMDHDRGPIWQRTVERRREARSIDRCRCLDRQMDLFL